jgi:hypothetical protein
MSDPRLASVIPAMTRIKDMLIECGYLDETEISPDEIVDAVQALIDDNDMFRHRIMKYCGDV